MNPPSEQATDRERRLEAMLVGAGVPLEDLAGAVREVKRLIAAEARTLAGEALSELLIVAKGHRDACLPRLLAFTVLKSVPGCDSVLTVAKRFDMPARTIYSAKIALELAFTAHKKSRFHSINTGEKRCAKSFCRPEIENSGHRG